MKRLYAVTLCVGLMFFCTAAIAQQKFNIMTEELPPFNFQKDGEVHGISADLLLLMLEKAGYPTDRSAIKLLPWARAYKTVQEEPGSVLFSMALTEEREKLFKWVGPLQEVSIGLVALKSRKIIVRNLDDLKKYRIGTVRENAAEQLLVKAGVYINAIDRIAEPEPNIRKLRADRIDMIASNVPTIFYVALRMGISPDEYEVIYTLKKAPFYFAFHKSTDDSVIEKLNRTLAEIRKPDDTGESSYDRIVKKYLGKFGSILFSIQ